MPTRRKQNLSYWALERGHKDDDEELSEHEDAYLVSPNKPRAISPNKPRADSLCVWDVARLDGKEGTLHEMRRTSAPIVLPPSSPDSNAPRRQSSPVGIQQVALSEDLTRRYADGEDPLSEKMSEKSLNSRSSSTYDMLRQWSAGIGKLAAGLFGTATDDPSLDKVHADNGAFRESELITKPIHRRELWQPQAESPQAIASAVYAETPLYGKAMPPPNPPPELQDGESSDDEDVEQGDSELRDTILAGLVTLDELRREAKEHNEDANLFETPEAEIQGSPSYRVSMAPAFQTPSDWVFDAPLLCGGTVPVLHHRGGATTTDEEGREIRRPTSYSYRGRAASYKGRPGRLSRSHSQDSSRNNSPFNPLDQSSFSRESSSHMLTAGAASEGGTSEDEEGSLQKKNSYERDIARGIIMELEESIARKLRKGAGDGSSLSPNVCSVASDVGESELGGSTASRRTGQEDEGSVQCECVLPEDVVQITVQCASPVRAPLPDLGEEGGCSDSPESTAEVAADGRTDAPSTADGSSPLVGDGRHCDSEADAFANAGAEQSRGPAPSEGVRCASAPDRAQHANGGHPEGPQTLSRSGDSASPVPAQSGGDRSNQSGSVHSASEGGSLTESGSACSPTQPRSPTRSGPAQSPRQNGSASCAPAAAADTPPKADGDRQQSSTLLPPTPVSAPGGGASFARSVDEVTLGDLRSSNSLGNRNHSGSSGGAASPAPRGSTASPAPRGSTASPAPRGSTASPAPRGSTASPAPRGSTASPVPRGSTASPAPRGSTASPAPRGSTASPAPRGSSGGTAGPEPRAGPSTAPKARPKRPMLLIRPKRHTAPPSPPGTASPPAAAGPLLAPAAHKGPDAAAAGDAVPGGRPTPTPDGPPEGLSPTPATDVEAPAHAAPAAPQEAPLVSGPGDARAAGCTPAHVPNAEPPHARLAVAESQAGAGAPDAVGAPSQDPQPPAATAATALEDAVPDAARMPTHAMSLPPGPPDPARVPANTATLTPGPPDAARAEASSSSSTSSTELQGSVDELTRLCGPLDDGVSADPERQAPEARGTGISLDPAALVEHLNAQLDLSPGPQPLGLLPGSGEGSVAGAAPGQAASAPPSTATGLSARLRARSPRLQIVSIDEQLLASPRPSPRTPNNRKPATSPAHATSPAARSKPATPAHAASPAARFVKTPPVTPKGSSARPAVPAPAPTAARSPGPRTPTGTAAWGRNVVPPATHIPARPLVGLQPAAPEHVPAEPRSKACAPSPKPQGRTPSPARQHPQFAIPSPSHRAVPRSPAARDSHCRAQPPHPTASRSHLAGHAPERCTSLQGPAAGAGLSPARTQSGPRDAPPGAVHRHVSAPETGNPLPTASAGARPADRIRVFPQRYMSPARAPDLPAYSPPAAPGLPAYSPPVATRATTGRRPGSGHAAAACQSPWNIRSRSSEPLGPPASRPASTGATGPAKSRSVTRPKSDPTGHWQGQAHARAPLHSPASYAQRHAAEGLRRSRSAGARGVAY